MIDAVELSLCEMLGVLLPLPIAERDDVGLEDRVLLALAVVLGVTLPVPVPVPLPVPVMVSLVLCVGDSEEVLLDVCEMLAVLLSLAPTEKDAVGLEDRVLLALAVEEGVAVALPVPLMVGLAVAEEAGVAGGVGEPERLVEGV